MSKMIPIGGQLLGMFPVCFFFKESILFLPQKEVPVRVVPLPFDVCLPDRNKAHLFLANRAITHSQMVLVSMSIRILNLLEMGQT